MLQKVVLSIALVFAFTGAHVSAQQIPQTMPGAGNAEATAIGVPRLRRQERPASFVQRLRCSVEEERPHEPQQHEHDQAATARDPAECEVRRAQPRGYLARVRRDTALCHGRLSDSHETVALFVSRP